MTLHHDVSDLADATDDFLVDEWAIEEFDDIDGAAELDSVRAIASRHALDD